MLPYKLLHGLDLQNHNHFIPKSSGVHCPIPPVGGKLNDSEDDSDPACGTEHKWFKATQRIRYDRFMRA
jgi:hypothetical protein